MAEKHRLKGKAFTCSNRNYQTNITKGKRHGSGQAKGSVFDQPLVSNHYTLWLEYVTEKNSDQERFWLMWYDADGSPTIPLSGVLSASQLKDMSGRLTDFIRLDGERV